MRGFDFLGYHFKPGMVCVAEKTVRNFKKHIDRLYEQGAGLSRIGQYVKKWVQWVKAGGMVAYLSHSKIYSGQGGGNPPLSPPDVSGLVKIPKICCTLHELTKK